MRGPALFVALSCQSALVGAVAIPVVACGGAVARAAAGSPAEGAKDDPT